MGQVSVTIAEKQYRIACDDGQEAHLTALAAEMDRRIADMRKVFGEIGDSRLTVMAAIAVLDEKSELLEKIKALETERDTLKQARELDQQTALELIDEAARRIEGVARQLMGTGKPAA
jgi:cell division protein ZapA